MALDKGSIDEIAERLAHSEARSEELFHNELAFVVEWKDAA